MHLPEIEKMVTTPSTHLTKTMADEWQPLLSGKTVRPTMPPGISSARLNLLGRSIVIHYDTAEFEPGWVGELLSTEDWHRFRTMLAELVHKYQSNKIA